MEKIILYDRQTSQKIEEDTYCRSAIEFLYSNNVFSKFFLMLLCRSSLFSRFFYYWNSLKISKYKIKPFIKQFNIDEKEFYRNTNLFRSFNDFFIRKLREDARKINYNEDVLVLPCDGRFLVFPKISDIDKLSIKNQKFNLYELLQDETLAQKYQDGSALLARLTPQDYHRFHFPCDCIPNEAKLINGYLYSVNPIAIRRNLKIFSENKRMITTLNTKKFSEILYIEIGATNVGSINQTFFPNSEYKKAEEKGYFSLGGSSVILLFQKDKIKFDDDLVEMSAQNIETKALFGPSFARKI